MIDFTGIELLGGLLGAGRLDNVLGLKHRVSMCARDSANARVHHRRRKLKASIACSAMKALVKLTTNGAGRKSQQPHHHGHVDAEEHHFSANAVIITRSGAPAPTHGPGHTRSNSRRRSPAGRRCPTAASGLARSRQRGGHEEPGCPAGSHHPRDRLHRRRTAFTNS